jgi:hypothetical protein
MFCAGKFSQNWQEIEQYSSILPKFPADKGSIYIHFSRIVPESNNAWLDFQYHGRILGIIYLASRCEKQNTSLSKFLYHRNYSLLNSYAKKRSLFKSLLSSKLFLYANDENKSDSDSLLKHPDIIRILKDPHSSFESTRIAVLRLVETIVERLVNELKAYNPNEKITSVLDNWWSDCS